MKHSTKMSLLMLIQSLNTIGAVVTHCSTTVLLICMGSLVYVSYIAGKASDADQDYYR